ncbi:MAG: hypothetical protein ACE5E1_10045 [Phycisphaerae bacterium]
MTTWISMLAQAAPNQDSGGDSIFVFPWYSWAGLGGIVLILIIYKVYKNKTMT